MPVMQIRVMRMPVPQGFMAVPMGMRFADRALMGVLMMVVMAVQMVMLQRLMLMLVVVPFGQMQPKPQQHQHRGRNECRARCVLEERQPQDRANERRK